jgi:hypothetical protein
VSILSVQSYNVPYFREIYDYAGWGNLDRGLAGSGAGDLSGSTYQTAARANIFRRDQGNVQDMNSLLDLMRENDYLSDPYSHGEFVVWLPYPVGSVLTPPGRRYFLSQAVHGKQFALGGI